jgi:hypothetical protein
VVIKIGKTTEILNIKNKGVLTVKFLWWVALVVAIIGVLLQLEVFTINVQFLTSFWIEVAAATLFAIAALGKK